MVIQLVTSLEDQSIDELVSAFRRLIPQVSPKNPPPGANELREIIASDYGSIFIARYPGEDGEIVGALTLIVFRIPTRVCGWIEDVVVDDPYRRLGIGEALTQAALQRAETLGASIVNLTSNPTRSAANRLYQKMGFVRPETNLYLYTIKKNSD